MLHAQVSWTEGALRFHSYKVKHGDVDIVMGVGWIGWIGSPSLWPERTEGGIFG